MEYGTTKKADKPRTSTPSSSLGLHTEQREQIKVLLQAAVGKLDKIDSTVPQNFNLSNMVHMNQRYVFGSNNPPDLKDQSGLVHPGHRRYSSSLDTLDMSNGNLHALINLKEKYRYTEKTDIDEEGYTLIGVGVENVISVFRRP